MSARKSWDIQPKRAGSSAPAPVARTTRRVEMTRAATPRSAPAPRARAARAVKERSPRSSSLRTKRKKERKLAWIGFVVLFLILLGIVLYVLWLPALRVQAVEAEGPDAEGIQAVSTKALEGNAFGILPRDSIFLIPEELIRADVLAAYPQVQAVSINAVGLTALKVKALTRTNAFVWCGESITAPASACYEADAEGLIFAPYEATTASTTASSTGTLAKVLADSGDLFVYGPLEGEGETPIRKHVTYASALPGALKFIKAMRRLGADIGSVTLRGDEVDLHTKAGTRITYVIGKEGEAAILAATSFPTLELNDGSINYIDLRFQNKVYVKRRGEVLE